MSRLVNVVSWSTVKSFVISTSVLVTTILPVPLASNCKSVSVVSVVIVLLTILTAPSTSSSVKNAVFQETRSPTLVPSE